MPGAASFRKPIPSPPFPQVHRTAALDEIGRDLPSLLHEKAFRAYARALHIPKWEGPVSDETLPRLRLYYVRVGFLAAAYVNQVGAEPAETLPRNIAEPLIDAARRLKRPPILSYDGYALYNWKRFRKDAPIRLGNIDTIQNFVHMYDEHWFILVHVEIESSQPISSARSRRSSASRLKKRTMIFAASCGGSKIASGGKWRCSNAFPSTWIPSCTYKTFRPYIRFFENVTYEGVDRAPMHFRGETGAQSGIMPTLVAFMKLPHQRSVLTDHLDDMRNYMPPEHRALIEEVEAMPDIRSPMHKEPYNAVLDAMADFRRVHYGWAEEYINRRTDDPTGTGGTPYMQWLQQMLVETEAHRA